MKNVVVHVQTKPLSVGISSCASVIRKSFVHMQCKMKYNCALAIALFGKAAIQL